MDGRSIRVRKETNMDQIKLTSKADQKHSNIRNKIKETKEE